MLYAICNVCRLKRYRIGTFGCWVASAQQDWGCKSEELLGAEEEEQPKVAMRRLILAT